jgi:VWFA-related protein
MFRVVLRYFVLVVVWGLANQAVAHQQPTQFPPPEQEQAPTFRADVTLITNDVIVRDNDGQFVSDLVKEDFEIFEDGIKQEIASLVLIHGGRAFNLQLPPSAPVQEGIILPSAQPRSDTAGRVFVLFIDDLHMEPDSTPRIRDLFKRISKNLVHEGDMFSMISSGPSSINIDFTYDRKLLDAAIGKIMGNGMTPTDVITGMQGSRGPSELLYRSNVAFATARNIVSGLNKIEHRRKAVIWVSAGYDLNPFEGSRWEAVNTLFEGRFRLDRDEEGNPLTTPGGGIMSQSNLEFSTLDLSNQLHRLSIMANQANATFYTLDPRGLIAGVDIGEMSGQLNMAEWWDFVRRSQDSLRTLAEATGGIAVVNKNDFDSALKRIDAETSDYYVLGYYSSNTDPSAWRRRLNIDVMRDDIDVWSRTAYELRNTDDAIETSQQ